MLRFYFIQNFNLKLQKLCVLINHFEIKFNHSSQGLINDLLEILACTCGELFKMHYELMIKDDQHKQGVKSLNLDRLF